MSMQPRRDWVIAVVIFFVALAVRLPFRARLAYWWDCGQSAIAIEQYNVLYSQPQAPGYFLYILLGRMVNLLVGDPLQSLIWISAVAGAVLTALGYLLGTAMFGRRCGLATAAILGTGLLTWFQSCIALMHILDGMLVCAFASCCWWAVRQDRGWRSVVVLAVVLSVLAGVRQQSGVMLLPLWLYAMSRMRPPRLPKIVAGSLVFGALCLLWFIPMAQSCSGLGNYLRAVAAFRGEFAKITPFGGGGWKALWENLDLIVVSCWTNLLAAGVLAAVGAARWVRGTRRDARWRWCAAHREQLLMLTWWVVPMLVFWLVMRVLWPGYVLGYLPALAILAGLCVARCGHGPGDRPSWWGSTAGIALVVVTNAVMFIVSPQWANGLLAGLPLTARELRQHDRWLDNWFVVIRKQFCPDKVLICHFGGSMYLGFRHFQYHLPEYESVMLTPDHTLTAPYDHQLWYGLNRRTEFAEQFEAHHKQKLLLVVPPGVSLEMFARHFNLAKVQPVMGGNGALFVVDVADALRSGQ